MQNKTALVFGGSGFVGRSVVQRLALQRYNIRVAVRNVHKAQFLKSMGEVGQILPIYCDIAAEQGLEAMMVGADVVVNATGIIAETGTQTFDRLHHQGPAKIAQAATACHIRNFVHISAMGADVDSPSKYARSKAWGEQKVLQYFSKACILRPSLIFGPDDHFFNLFGRIAKLSPILPLIGGGHNRFQPIYVGDVAASVMRVIDDNVDESNIAWNDHGKTFELGGPNIVTFHQLLLLMTEILKRPKYFLPIPYGLAHIMGKFLELFPNPLLTADQVTLLKTDNLPSPGALTIADLGVKPEPLIAILPEYLKQFVKNY